MKKLLAVVLLALSFNALADQCQWVTTASAKKAVNLIKKSKKTSGGVLELCQPCGEGRAQEVRVNQIDILSTGDAQLTSEVAINGRAIDLAYTFVDVGNGKFVNLAKLSRCEAHDVSLVISQEADANGRIRYIPGPIY